jgi:hypothetical protein
MCCSIGEGANLQRIAKNPKKLPPFHEFYSNVTLQIGKVMNFLINSKKFYLSFISAAVSPCFL